MVKAKILRPKFQIIVAYFENLIFQQLFTKNLWLRRRATERVFHARRGDALQLAGEHKSRLKLPVYPPEERTGLAVPVESPTGRRPREISWFGAA